VNTTTVPNTAGGYAEASEGYGEEGRMSPDEPLAGLAEILGSIARVHQADVTADALFADLGVDSLAMVEVVVAAEDRFGLLIDDDHWSRFRTVGDAVRYIEQASTIDSIR
jgi:acyl carrier protein